MNEKEEYNADLTIEDAEKTEKTESVVRFLNLVLDVCDKIVYQTRNGCSKIEIKTVDVQGKEGAEQIDIHGFYVDKLFQVVYKAVRTGDNIIQIRFNGEPVEVKNPFSKLEFLDVNSGHTDKLEEILSTLKDSFLEGQYLNPLVDKLYNFMSERKSLQETALPFLEMAQLTRYTEAYYNVLLVLFEYADVYSTQEFIMSKEQGSLLDLLLSLDTHENKNENENGNTKCISLLSPVALCNVQKMYKLVESYIRECSEPGMEKNTVLPLFYRDAMVRKILHAFRWFTSGTGESITHAAIPAFSTNISGNLQISIRSVKEYSSFEGIGELRVAEKIVYEVRRILENKNLDKIKIAILGDLNVEPLKKLQAYLYDVLYNSGSTSEFDGYSDENLKKNKSENITSKQTVKASEPEKQIPPITITAYSKNFLQKNSGQFRESELGEIVLTIDTKTNLDEIFSNATNLSELLNDNNIIFMLDCTKLYKPVETQEERSINIIKTNLTLSKALDYAEGITDLCSQVRLEELYELMLVYMQQRYFGKFKKYANDSILKFCEERVKKIGEPCTVFAYVSDLPAFNHLYCSDQYYVRVENYNEKEIGIIRFTNGGMDKDILDNTNNFKTIVFNAWQFVKHLCLNSADKITKVVSELVRLEAKNESKFDLIRTIDLQRLNFGLDYSDWKNELLIFYGVESEVNIGAGQTVGWYFRNGKEYTLLNKNNEFVSAFMRVFAEKIILPIFSFKDNVFQDYFAKAIYSFLYGNAKNTNDMLFIHLFKKKRKLLGKVRLLTGEDELPGDVLRFMNYEYKYSIKRFIELIMQANDTTATASVKQLFINQTADNSYSDGGAAKIYEKIIKSCDTLDYGNSNLYKNCENKRKGVFYG